MEMTKYEINATIEGLKLSKTYKDFFAANARVTLLRTLITEFGLKGVVTLKEVA